jgi:transmembrane sensor
VNFSARVRFVELVKGEALFEVRPDPRRPFTVTAGDASIRDVGTRFNVYRGADNTTVSVLEGEVQVSVRQGSPRPLLADPLGSPAGRGRQSAARVPDAPVAQRLLPGQQGRRGGRARCADLAPGRR